MRSMVAPSAAPLGMPFGRTLTAMAPVSLARSTNACAVSICLRRAASSGDWNSQVVP